MKLIDKAAVVAEIEKIIADETESIKTFEHSKNVSERQRSNARIEMLMYIRSLLDTLEVKEVDLEKELESFAYTLPHSAIGDGEHLGKFDDPKVKEARKYGWSHLWRYNYVKEIAKHFFELGLKAQKG